MIRKRLKAAARKAAIRIFKMETDTLEHEGAGKSTADPSRYDENLIPKVVAGSGDTPGPNHKEDIGRTWLSAQLAGGVAPFLVDMRPPSEVATGILPGAVLLPGRQVAKNLHRLPPKDQRVTVYDQTGHQGSKDTAEWLRSQGWELARRLRGGFAEWMENGEPVTPAPGAKGARHRVGDPVTLAGGRTGWVQEVRNGDQGVRYVVWFPSDESEEVGSDGIGG